MIVTVKDFCNYVEHNQTKFFVKKVFKEMGKTLDEESNEFKNTIASYNQLSPVFSIAIKKNSKFGEVQICTIDNISLIAEYKLPSSSARCDVVLLGKGKEKNQVLIIENKNFDFWGETEPCGAEGLVMHNGHEQEHPADQVRGYVEYCKYFHSTVQEYDAGVDGCVFFSQPLKLSPFKEKPNDTLCEEYPIFNTNTTADLADYIIERIEEGDNEFAAKFENGYYMQNRNLLKQVASNISDSDERQFVLLENQRKGFNMVMSELNKCINGDDKKKVIIVEGPPGSGKSAIAINLWTEVVKVVTAAEECGKKMDGNIVYVSTSQTQKENWKTLFKKSGKKSGAKNIVLAANDFNPGLNSYNCHKYGPAIRKMDAKYIREDEKDYTLNNDYYEDYTNILISNNWAKGYKDNQHLLSIVDEAHALINPIANGFKSNNAGGWFFSIGPQAYHIIRQSKISIFLMDSEQSYRDNETTTIEDIKAFANKFGIKKVIQVSLNDVQFRCNGSIEYVDWATHLFRDKHKDNYKKWKNAFHVEVVDYPSEVEEYLRKKMEKGEKNVRLLSSFSKKWTTRGLSKDHSNKKDYDFDLEDKEGRRFKKYWNSEYTAFIQGVERSVMENDPLSEVGCPYTVRGFDYDHIGLLWLGDMVWRKDHWMLNIENIEESGLSSPKKDAKEEQKARLPRGKKNIGLVDAYNSDMPHTKNLAEAVAQAYRILMTRAIKSVCIYIEDIETREHVRSLLK